jgi:hypothetical protein
VVVLPEAVPTIIAKFQSVFEAPAKLPPRRACDHKIPLILRATPTNVRPYRYALAMEDDIEKQIKEMLQAGVIQPNTSAFSSLVLLVKKKDGS